jgi:hypothetical protein
MNNATNDKDFLKKKNPITEEPTVYHSNEDIYIKSEKVDDVDPDDISKLKIPNEKNREEFVDDESGGDLDIPGSELDDTMENIGSEDEENNHYSLGGDNHNDLEED